MQNQYLIIAENITYKNNKLSCINIMDQFLAVQLPAEFFFDLVVICGPGWQQGEYDLTIKAKSNTNEAVEIGSIKVGIPHDNFVYNAIAANLKIGLGYDVNVMTFMVYKNDELVLERTYPVNSLLVPVENPEQKQEQPQ